MTDGLRRGGARARATLVRAFLLVGIFASAAGCGAGDDTVSAAPLPAKDAGAGDATTAAPEGGSQEAGATEAGTKDAASGGSDADSASAMFSQAAISFGDVNCSASGSQTFPIVNSGSGVLTVSASTIGSAFSVSPTSLSLPKGASGMFTLTASVPGSATAGTSLQGSLNLFTNDPAHSNVPIALTATPTGATIVDATLDTAPVVGFPSSEVNTPSSPQQLTLKNIGNGPAAVTFGVPSDPQFTLESADAGPLTALAGGSVLAAFDFTPTTATKTPATSTVTVTGAQCGISVSTVTLNGQGATGAITGYPSSTINFGPVACGGNAPAPQTITLTNTGAVNALITTSSLTGTGFTTSAKVGQGIPANGGTLVVAFTSPPVPAVADPTKPITAQVTLQTDADATPQTITLSETPSGAVLAFDTTDPPATPGFGSFGSTGLLLSDSQTFVVKNTGNQAANVVLVAASSTAVDAGTGAPATFSVSTPSFSVASSGTQTDSATYAATSTGTQAGNLSMQVAPGTTLCAPLPAPLPLTGSGMGGEPSISQISLAFTPTCGRGAPPSQTLTVGNSGTSDMTWALSAVTGPGAASYSVSSTPAPGTLHPGDSASVTVTAAAVPSPAANPSPSAYAAQIAITTDVPFDAPHVVSLSETPLGDQLSFSTDSLRFGQFPIDTTTLPETFTVTNNANAGSPAANLGLSVSAANQVTASAYAVTPASIGNLAPGGGVSNPISVTFDPTSPATYPATLGISTTDGLCTALPSPIGLIGTGTQAKVNVSATTLAFGTDPSDAKGLVNCGATGLPQTITISNTGNQAFQITSAALGLASSPFVLSGPGSVANVTVPIRGSTTITLTPNPIPATVANPNDPSPFSDTLTITTNASSDSPHHVSLVMQARGAVIASTPVATTWSFGTVGGGSIGTFANTITNTGNAAVSIALTGLKQPSIFGLQANPSTAGPNAVTAVIGQFTPPSANGQWSDQGTLVVTPVQGLCEPLPAAWTSPAVTMSGSSNATPSVTVAGSLTFPSSDCGSAAPAGQAITLTNQTNQSFAFSTAFSSGAFYQATAASDAGASVLPAGGSAMVVVTPKTVTPGPGVSAGSAPYVDDVTITVQSSPPTTFTIPISWTLNGAVLSLPDALGQHRDAMGNAFYAADTTSGFELPIVNTGTATASVSFGLQPAGAFTFSPAGAIAVQPGITALPRLSASASDAACPALTTGSVTFLYSGPVCQPIPASGVSIDSCVGTF
jgi:hypothetical protein